MTLNEYQSQAYQTALYPGRGTNFVYPALGLAGEAGEVANQVKKILRDDQNTLTEDRRAKLIDELGDCFWYLAAMAEELGTDLDWIGRRNLMKLDERKAAGTLTGERTRL